MALLVAARQPTRVRSLVVGEPPLLTWLAQPPDGQAILGAFASTTWEPVRQAFARGEADPGVRLFLDGAVGSGAFDQLPPPARTMMLDNALAMRLETQTPLETYISAFSLSPADAEGIKPPALVLTVDLTPTMFRRIDVPPDRRRAGQLPG